MSMKNWKSILKAIIAIIIVIGIIVLGISAIKKAKSKDASSPPAKVYDVVVTTQVVKKDPIKLTLPYLAIAKNDRDVNLSSKISGRVNFMKASGSKVKKGALIAKLDDAGIQSNISSIKAQFKAINTSLANMQATHKRTLELVAVNGASIEQSQNEESKISEIISKKEALTQKMNELNNTLTYAVIKSPVDGIISKTMVNVGDMAMPGHPIANIKAKNGFYLLVRVPTDLKITGVELNNKYFEAIPLNSTFNGLAEYKAYTDIPDITSGDRVEANTVIYNDEGILLPFDAVINRDGKSYVLLRDGDIANSHEVSIIESGEQGIVISNDELIGKEIVIAKQDILLKLLTGVSLKVKEG